MATQTADDKRRYGTSIRVTGETWAKMQKLATSFSSSERGTPDKVIVFLLDHFDATSASS